MQFRLILVLALASWRGFAETPSEAINEHLPKWVRLGFDHRFRMEGYTALRNREDNDDRWFLNRLRMNLTLAPASWWTFTFQGQDSRIFFKSNPAGQNPFTNKTDLRMAFTDFGKIGKGPVAFRFGRQELAYGDERILGAANWGNVARVFDAAKLELRKGKWEADLVSASVVVPQLRGLSHHLEGNNLHFLYTRWKNPIPNTTIEPYFLWRVGGSDALGAIRHQDRRVAGLRVAGKLPAQWQYTSEWIAQFGNVNNAFGNESIHAVAEHTVVSYSFAGLKYKPRILSEFNFASGDRTPGDRRSGTFDQLYPTPHEKYGLADQVGWQNIQHFSAGAELNITKQLVLKSLAHDWRLAQSRDGLYAANGSLLFRDLSGRSGRHVGEEIDVVAQYTVKGRYLGGGYGHLFPGQFLHAQTPGVGLNYLYLNVGYSF